MQTSSLNTITNPLFRSLGFKEYRRGEEPLWEEPGHIGLRARMPRGEYMHNFGGKRMTIRDSEFVFFRIELISEKTTEHDLLTWRQFFTNALQKDNGLVGSSVHVDILQHITDEEAEQVIVRVPNVHHRMFWEAVSSWADVREGLAMRVVRKSESLIALT